MGSDQSEILVNEEDQTRTPTSAKRRREADGVSEFRTDNPHFFPRTEGQHRALVVAAVARHRAEQEQPDVGHRRAIHERISQLETQASVQEEARQWLEQEAERRNFDRGRESQKETNGSKERLQRVGRGRWLNGTRGQLR